MIEPQELRDLIRSTLTPLGLYSADAEELLVATCAQESHLGVYRQQIGGPALGIYQMEPEDFYDIWKNYLAYHPQLADAIRALNTSTVGVIPGELINNDAFATAMARVHYLRAPGTLPAAADLEAIWAYYKAHYNTPAGAATHDQFIANYHRYVA